MPHNLARLRELFDDELLTRGSAPSPSPRRASSRSRLWWRAPVIVTVQARLARLFAAELGLSLSPPPVELSEVTISLLWHASYDHDPAHIWLRELVTQLAAEL